jgi:NAD(P)H-flavin reductase
LSAGAQDRPQAPFGTRSARVVARRDVGPYVVLSALDGSGVRPVAGQFYMLRSADRWGGGSDGRPYLPRALSFARAADSDGGVELDFMLEVVGPGTERLSELRQADELVLAGPFGNGFAPDAGRGAVLVAGGIGLAPVVALADSLRAQGRSDVRAFVGMRSAAHAEAVAQYGLQHELATDDGSAGHRGFVTELVAEHLAASDGASAVYACGPPAMLEAVRGLCADAAVPVQLAMESGMACGFGACHGCVVPTREGYLRLCLDGPVIDGALLESALPPEAS